MGIRSSVPSLRHRSAELAGARGIDFCAQIAALGDLKQNLSLISTDAGWILGSTRLVAYPIENAVSVIILVNLICRLGIVASILLV